MGADPLRQARVEALEEGRASPLPELVQGLRKPDGETTSRESSAVLRTSTARCR
jgi:hypothetical protein